MSSYTFICIQKNGVFETYVIPYSEWENFVSIFIENQTEIIKAYNCTIHVLNHHKYSCIICMRNI